MTNEQDFQAMLDDNPEDHTTRLILADRLEDFDDPRAMGYRVLAKLRVSPDRCRRGAKDKVDWIWYYHYNHTPRHGLQIEWWYTLEKFLNRPQWNLITDRPYNTRKEAEDDAALTWTRLTPNLQNYILTTIANVETKPTPEG
jgi:uncharacterized protein (TIGR02996 family)